MNLSQLKELKDGQEVTFTNPFPSFTEGKKYKVRDTGAGKMVYDDNGIGVYLADMETKFKA